MKNQNIDIVRVDFSNPTHAEAMCDLLTEYAQAVTHEEGAKTEPFDPHHFDRLPERLQAFPMAFSVLAYDGQAAVGLINCFFGFSTFALKKLVNIHDVMVTQSARGRGIVGLLMAEVEQIAREHDCCRLTLEVLDNNLPARRAYEKQGFARTPYHPENDTLFLQKDL